MCCGAIGLVSEYCPDELKYNRAPCVKPTVFNFSNTPFMMINPSAPLAILSATNPIVVAEPCSPI